MRPVTTIPEAVSSPYPIYYDANVVCGFGRGSAELGIPTANIPVGMLNSLETGVYFGWCKLSPTSGSRDDFVERSNGGRVHFNNGQSLTDEDLNVLPMVMSIGWNPFYENKQKAAEVHVIHQFGNNFYGASMEVVILGYIRPELNYTTKEALIKDINIDIDIAKATLLTPSYESFKRQVTR